MITPTETLGLDTPLAFRVRMRGTVYKVWRACQMAVQCGDWTKAADIHR